MKIFLTVAFLLFNCATIFAQSDIEQEIRNLPDTPSDLLIKARRLLQVEFTNGNLLKVKALKEYIMDSLSNDSLVGLSEIEQVFLQYWTRDFSNILTESVLPSIDKFEGCRIGVPYPLREPLLSILHKKTHEKLDTLFSFIEMSTYSQEDKDFLKLHLHSILIGTRYWAFDDNRNINREFRTQEELNQLADHFLQQYPNSKYENYIRTSIRVVYRRSETALGLDFSIGAGMYSGQMADIFRMGVVVSLGAEYNFKDLGILGRLAYEDGKTKNDISMNGISVKKGATLQMTNVEIGASYSVFENRLLKIAPLATVGFATYSPLQKDIDENPGLQNATKGVNFIYTLGLNWDFKMGSDLYDYFYYPLRVRYGYTALDFKNSGISGGIHMITFGIGIFAVGMERDY